ncbi:FtsQ-type POTRA domain-containing protein [bacterium]|nr:MAG: FtsQ-type POTRA domain-containing protein [bacterium]
MERPAASGCRRIRRGDGFGAAGTEGAGGRRRAAGGGARSQPGLARVRRAVRPTQRRRPPLRARLKAASLVLAVLAGLAAYGGFRLAEWPGFEVQRVIVTGNGHLSAEQVVAAAAVPHDRNLWLLPLGPVRRRVESLPWVAHVRLARRPPAFLRIEVTERVPAAVVPLDAGAAPGFALVDPGGHVLERGERKLWGYPLVRGAAPGAANFPRVIADLETLATEGVRVRELDVTPLGELVAVTYTRLRLDLGDDEDLSHKASLVNPIIARLGRRVAGVAALDLRAPGTPVVVYR